MSRKNIALVLVLALISLLLFSIFLLDRFGDKNYEPLQSTGNFKAALYKLESVPEIANSSLYYKVKQRATNLESSDVSYEDMILIKLSLDSLYSELNNPLALNAARELSKLAKQNFPKEYTEEAFFIPCQDSTCQDNPTPEEIKTIIDEINTSNLDEFSKEEAIKNLKNASYVSETNKSIKVRKYVQAIDFIKTDEGFIKAGINLDIAGKVANYLIASYKNDVYKFLSTSTDGQSRDILLRIL